VKRQRKNPFKCVYCKTGSVLPVYRKNREPKYRCDNCKQLHTSKERFTEAWLQVGYHLTINKHGAVSFG